MDVVAALPPELLSACCWYSDSLLILTVYFFLHAPATTEIYTLSLHDALPISAHPPAPRQRRARHRSRCPDRGRWRAPRRRIRPPQSALPRSREIGRAHV